MVILSVFLKIAAFAQFVFFYQEGGQGHKWMRSWLGPSVLAGLLLLIQIIDHRFSLLAALGALLYIAAANGFAYGEKFTHNKTSLKILFRGLCGASYGLCGLLIGIGGHQVFIGLLQLTQAIIGSIALGVFNPFPTSWGNKATRAEDTGISLGYILFVMFMV
jgi:hypothetical protein